MEKKTKKNFSHIASGSDSFSRNDTRYETSLSASLGAGSFCFSPSLSSSNVHAKNEETKEELLDQYKQEYSVYLLRSLQSKILQEEKEREEDVKKCLVSLKLEYQELLEENAELYKEVQMLEAYEKSIMELEEEISLAQEMLNILKKTEFNKVLDKLSQDLEIVTNRLHLADLKRNDMEEAFHQNLLGFDSPIFKQLKIMENFVSENKALVAETASEITTIQNIYKKNEELKKRCIEIADSLRSHTIRANYEKIFKIAAEQFQSIIRRPTEQKSVLEESEILKATEEAEPIFSSTPNN